MDVRTLTLVNLLLLIGYTGALFVLARSQPALRGARWIARAYAAGVLGSLLIAGRDHIPDLLSIVFGGMLVLLTSVFVHFAMEEFAGAPRARRSFDYAIIGVAVPLFFWYTFGDKDLAARIVFFSLLALIECGLTAFALVSPARQYGDASIWAMILIMLGEAIAYGVRITLTLVRLSPAHFMASDPVQAATMLGYLLSAAAVAFDFIWMSTARLRHDLAVQARTDLLTGLLNRRALLDHAQRLLRNCHLNRSPLSIIVVDLDSFKTINDTWGHETGDRVLEAVSVTFRQEARRTDLVARFGGEEFLLVLPNTPGDDALNLAQRLRAAIESMVICTHEGNVSVTASFGVTTHNPGAGEESWSTLLRRGDRALYRAKTEGRNRTVVA